VKFDRYYFQKLSVQARERYRKSLPPQEKPELTPEQKARLDKAMKLALKARQE